MDLQPVFFCLALCFFARIMGIFGSAIPRLAIPVVVIEIVFGVLFGKQRAGLVPADQHVCRRIPLCLLAVRLRLAHVSWSARTCPCTIPASKRRWAKAVFSRCLALLSPCR